MYEKMLSSLFGFASLESEKMQAEIRELRKHYAGTVAEYKAPIGKSSKLIERLGEEMGRQVWYAVRTSCFKEWFGDWERLARIAEFKNLEIKNVKISKPISKKDAEKQANKEIVNKKDGRISVIPVNTVGKILGHQGYDISIIYNCIPLLYETSILGFSEAEIQREGKNPKTNVKEYHHYFNKFSDGIGKYNIRITLYEEKSRTKKRGKNYIHSTAISEIEINENGEDSQRIRVMYPGEANSSPFVDLKLKYFINSVNPASVSKAIDENGEPLPENFPLH
jgi:hypothetical protein